MKLSALGSNEIKRIGRIQRMTQICVYLGEYFAQARKFWVKLLLCIEFLDFISASLILTIHGYFTSNAENSELGLGHQIDLILVSCIQNVCFKSRSKYVRSAADFFFFHILRLEKIQVFLAFSVKWGWLDNVSDLLCEQLLIKSRV